MLSFFATVLGDVRTVWDATKLSMSVRLQRSSLKKINERKRIAMKCIVDKKTVKLKPPPISYEVTMFLTHDEATMLRHFVGCRNDEGNLDCTYFGRAELASFRTMLYRQLCLDQHTHGSKQVLPD